MKNGRDYEVGYGKPPVDTRFKPGQSGHRAGRPKERLSELDEIIKAVDKKVKLPDGRTRSKLQLGLEKLKSRAIKGDRRASSLLAQVEAALHEIPAANPCVMDIFESDLGHLDQAGA